LEFKKADNDIKMFVVKWNTYTYLSAVYRHK